MTSSSEGLAAWWVKFQSYANDQQEIWNNAHVTCCSIGLNLFPRNSLSKYASQAEIVKNSLQTRYFCTLRSFKVIDVGTPGKLVSSACYDQQKSVSICNHSRARLVDSSKNHAFFDFFKVVRAIILAVILRKPFFCQRLYTAFCIM